MDYQNYTVEDLVCDESFQRYCLGNDPTAIQFWESWVRENPQQKEIVEEAVRLFEVISAKQGNLSIQLENLKDGIRRFDMLKMALEKEEDTLQGTVPHHYPNRFRWRIGIAASVLALATAGYFFFKLSSPKSDSSATFKHIATETGIVSGNEPRKTVVLPDGSVVTLRSNSKLVLAKDFNTSSRELHLSGEAFFDVAHQQNRPFVVHTEEVNIEVLGTVFNVSAYPENDSTETALFRGKVAVTRNGHPEEKVILSPSQKIVYAHKENKVDNERNKPFHVVTMLPDPVNHKAKEIAWVRNRLKIEDEPLEVIAARLQQWYGIPIGFASEEVKSYRYSGTFESESVVKALEALQLSYPFSFDIRKDSILISK
ncbi:FecR family protein [Pseudoflavitalea rhizosphaerae]|uniref:FecR family protein n=1 Tax=Pseudoflavitalea rhizosphaerae TaxID=1884793 RepID=UPI000F8EBD47|nr:FecR domain-containing protein [Pseudoflavitalea rhizosphaerae]